MRSAAATILSAVACVLAGAALAGCGSGQWHVVQPSASEPSPAQSGVVYSGGENCAFDAKDGDIRVYVIEKGIQGCTEMSSALAGSGTYWNPDSVTAIDRYRASGMLPNADRYCALSANSMTMEVYGVSQVDEPISSGLASRICAAEEANGWTAVVQDQG